MLEMFPFHTPSLLCLNLQFRISCRSAARFIININIGNSDYNVYRSFVQRVCVVLALTHAASMV